MSDTKHTPERECGDCAYFGDNHDDDPCVDCVDFSHWEPVITPSTGMADPAAEIAALRAELERKDARIRELEGKVADGILNAANCMSERDEWKAKAERYLVSLKLIQARSHKPGPTDGVDAIFCFREAYNAIKDVEDGLVAGLRKNQARAAIEEE